MVHEANWWGDKGYLEYAEKVRQVHGIDFLTDAHLKQSVNKKSLRQWIEASAQRGSISKWNPDLYKWALTEQDEGLESVRWNSEAVLLARKELCIQGFFEWTGRWSRSRNVAQ